MPRTPHIVATLLLLAAMAAFAQAPAGTHRLDAVVAVVNNRPILLSDVNEELRLAVLDPAQAGQVELTPQKALEQLISRALIQQQIRREEERVSEPSSEEVQSRLSELRRELPACVHSNCSSEQGWAAFLAAHGLTPEHVERSLRLRVEILRFIELRFRAGLRITPEEIEAYYRTYLAPAFKPGEVVPSLETVSQRIEEILLEKRVNALFDQWLDNLRKQGDVEVLDPELETQPATEPAPGAASDGKEALR
jgi:hypothetical protein